jgi:hypothetical protein
MAKNNYESFTRKAIQCPMKHKLKGPGGLVVELDSEQVFPEDPGQGTPAMCHLGRLSSTFDCALAMGAVDDKPLAPAQLKFLDGLEDQVNLFIEQHST